MISSLAERSLPWIPVIGLVSPEESILFKKLVDTSNCSNNENSTTYRNKIRNGVAQQEDEKDSEEVELIDGRSKNRDNEMNDDSDKMEIAESDIKENSIEGNELDKEYEEIFNNSILLEKVMQQWREALNQRAEIIAQRSAVSTLNVFHISFLKYKICDKPVEQLESFI